MTANYTSIWKLSTGTKTKRGNSKTNKRNKVIKFRKKNRQSTELNRLKISWPLSVAQQIDQFSVKTASNHVCCNVTIKARQNSKSEFIRVLSSN